MKKQRRFLMDKGEEVTIRGIFSTTSRPSTPTNVKAGAALSEAMRQAPNNTGEFKTAIQVVYVDNTTANVINRSILPAELKKDLPFMLFLAYDLPAYNIMNKIYPYINYNPVLPASFSDWGYVTTSVYGAGFTGFNNSDLYCKRGDLIQQYFSLFGGSWSAYVIISGEMQSYSAILEETKRTTFITRDILYITDNILNYNQPIQVVQSDPVGNYKAEQFMPFSFRDIDVKQPDFISLKLNLRLNRFLGILSLINFDTQKITFEFKTRY